MNCINLTSIDLSSFDIYKVINLDSIFHGCINLTYINLSSFESENKLLSFKNIFFNCIKLIKIKISPSFSQIINPEIKENIELIVI